MVVPAHQRIPLKQVLSSEIDREYTATRSDRDATISIVSAALESSNGNGDALSINGDKAGSDVGHRLVGSVSE